MKTKEHVLFGEDPGKTKGSSEEILHDFSWGDTRGVREELLKAYPHIANTQFLPLNKFGYPPEEGDADLKEHLKKLTLRLTGIRYNHILVTAGCSHALNAAIDGLATITTETVLTRSTWYPRYPEIISQSKLIHGYGRRFYHGKEDILMVDSPSNPLGIIGISDIADEIKTDKIIWDGAYQTPTYWAKTLQSIGNAKVFCGSLSKLSGINGIRIGWTATNDDKAHTYMSSYVRTTISGVSYPSQFLANEILSDEAKLEDFFIKSKRLIEDNKNEILRLKTILGSDDVPKYGMFAVYGVDSKLLSLFKKARVKFTDGRTCGLTFDSVRVNLGNTREQTKDMVDALIKADRI